MAWSPAGFQLQPNRAYQVYTSAPAIWTFGTAQPPPSGSALLKSGRRSQAVNMEDATTWSVNAAEYANTMILIAEMTIDEAKSVDSLDKVGAFINGECRGVAELQYIAELDSYIATLLVYANQDGETVNLRLYDADQNEVFWNTETFSFTSNGIIGSVREPHQLQSLIKPTAILNATPVFCATDQTGSVQVADIPSGTPPFNFQWSGGSEDYLVEGLASGMYTFTMTDATGQTFLDSIRVENADWENQRPEIDILSGKTICLNTDVRLAPKLEDQLVEVQWYNQDGTLLSQARELTIPDISEDLTLKAKVSKGNCISLPMEISLKVQAPTTAFKVEPSTSIQLGDTLRFSPELLPADAEEYLWDFGNGNWTREAKPEYIYPDPGLYDITLRVKDTDGCRNSIVLENFVEVSARPTSILDLNNDVIHFHAAPNPFTNSLKAMIEVRKSDRYTLRMLDMRGRLVYENKLELNAGVHGIRLDLGNTGIADGAYLLKLIQHQDVKAVQKVIRKTP